MQLCRIEFYKLYNSFGGLSIIHFNARSLNDGIVTYCLSTLQMSLDVMPISETWFYNNTAVSLKNENYIPYYTNRNNN